MASSAGAAGASGGGSGGSSGAGGADPTSQVWELSKEAELRLEVEDSRTCYIKLLSGVAEVFGIEMAEDTEYELRGGSKTAVFSWYGCKVQTRGEFTSSYVSTDTPMAIYANVHQRLEARREAASAGGTGPRVMVVGPTDSGKSSLTRLLLAYAIRRGRTPVLVDLDVGQGELGIPGCIGASVLSKTSLHPVSGFVLTAPLMYYYGSASPSENPDLFRLHVQRLASNMNTMPASGVKSSGFIVNTCGWVEDLGFKLLVSSARALGIDVVLVIGQDKLHADLTRELSNPSAPAGAEESKGAEPPKRVEVIKLPRTGGVVIRSSGFRTKNRTNRVRDYFYGLSDVLTPCHLTVKFDEVDVYRIGGDKTSDSMLLPVGQSSVLDPVRVTKVPHTELIHCVLAVSYATAPENIPQSNVAGFVHVRKIDPAAKTITLLAPCPGPLPNRLLIRGDIIWIE